MKEFVFGTDQQFQELKLMLEDNKCHVYKCELPSCCSGKQARIGFEKADQYILYVDKGLEAHTEDSEFQVLIRNGQVRFCSFEELVQFFRNRAHLYFQQREEKVVGVVDYEAVCEEKKDTILIIDPEDIANPLKKKIFGQDRQIERLSEKIAINLMKKQEKLLTVGILGPTATGKSETGKCLAGIVSELTKREYGYIEIAGNEYIGEADVHKILGAPPGYIGHGQPTKCDSIRTNPYHIIVINEIEKANEKLLISLMEAIDTGRLGLADNTPDIDLTHCIMLFTSNLPIDMAAYRESSAFEMQEMCRDTFTKHCKKPEISGKIGNFIAFAPLNLEAQAHILEKQITETVTDQGFQLKKIETELMKSFLEYSNRTQYGARAIRVLVEDSVGTYLLHNRTLIHSGCRQVILKGTVDHIQMIGI